MARVALAILFVAALYAEYADAMSMGPSQGSNMQPSSNDSSQNWFDSDPGFFESMEGIMENLKYEFEDRFYDLNISARNDNMTEFLHKKINESMNELFDELMEKNMSAMNSSDFKGIFREMVNDSNEMMLMDLKHMNTAQMNFTEFKNMFGQLKNATSQLMIGGIRDMNISAMYDRFYQQMGNYSMSYSFSMTPPVGGPAGSGKGPGTTDAPLPPGQTDRVTQRNNGVTDRVTQKDNSGKQTTRRPGNVVTDGPQQRTTTTQANQNLPGGIQKDSLTKDQQRKLEEAFGSDSTSSFTGNTLFDPSSGNLTGEFWDTLDNDEKQAMDDIQRMGNEAFDLAAIFSDSLADDFVFFAQTFANMDQTAFQKFIDTPGSVQPGDLDDVSLSVLSAMNETTMREKLGQLPEATQEKVCKMLQNEEADYDSTKRIVKGIDCPARLAARNIITCGSLSEAIAENKMEEDSPDNWNNAKWRDAMTKGWLSGLPKEVIAKCPGYLLRQNMDKVDMLKECLDKDVQEKIFEKVKSNLGGFDRMSKDDIANMGSMVGQLSFREMKNLDSTTVKESMSTLKDSASSMNRLQKMQIKKSVKEADSAANWSADDIVNSAVFCGTDRNIIDNLPTDKVIQNITELGAQEFDRRSSRAFAKKIRESSDYDEPSDFSTEKFKNMGKLASGFSSRFIKNMTSVNFGDVLTDGSLVGVDFPKDSARSLVDRIKTDMGGSFNQANLEKLDKAVVGLRKDEVDNVNGDDLANALENMKDTISEVMVDMDDTTIAAMVEKVETATGGLGANLEKMGPLLQKVPVKKLQAISDSDFGDMSGKTERNFNCSSDTPDWLIWDIKAINDPLVVSKFHNEYHDAKGQENIICTIVNDMELFYRHHTVPCPELYKRVKNSIGTPGLRNPNFTLSTFKNLKSVMCGMPLDDLRSLPATTVLEDVAGYLLELKCLSDKQERVLAEKLKYRLGLFSGSIKSIRRQDVNKYGGIMKHFAVSELQQLGRCEDISLQLGAQDLSNIKKEDLKELAKYALECVNKTQGQLTTDDVTTAGDLICGLDTNRIKDIQSDAISDVVFNVQSKCSQLDIKERQKWTKDSMEKLNITSANIGNVGDVELTQMGTFTGEIDKSTMERIPNDVMSSVSPDIVDQFSDLDTNLGKMDDTGFGADVNTKVRDDRDKKKKQVYTKMIDSFTTPSNGARRRKRSTTPLTCDDMQLLGSGVTALSSSQIEATADAEFLDCAQTLGGYSTWDSSQLLSLLTVASRSGTYGDSSTWSSDDVYNLGIIAQGLTSTELSALTQLTIDSMYSIGRHDGWSETQLSAGFERWLSLNKNSNATTVTSTELISLGHFACGASTIHINDVDSTIYSYAASYIGELTSCQESQLVSWANHAKTAFGGVTTWDTSVITTVGTVIGGLTSSEIGSLTTTQVAAILPASIAEIPSATFVGFTVDQLSSFSTAQALSTTASQQAGLSSAQLSALESAGAYIYGAASTIQMSCIALFIAAMMAMVLK